MTSWYNTVTLQQYTLYIHSLTRNTNSRAPRGMGTGDVSPSVPDTVTHALADVLAALVFLEANIVTRYGSSARQTEKALTL